MRRIKSRFALAAFVLCTLALAINGNSQGVYRSGTIDAGTTITVRTNESIDTKNSDGRVFSGVVEQDVLNRNGNIAIPKGSEAELIVKKTSDNEVALDLDSVTVNGQRYSILGETQSNAAPSQQKEGIGANKRTGKYVGGGAAIRA